MRTVLARNAARHLATRASGRGDGGSGGGCSGRSDTASILAGTDGPSRYDRRTCGSSSTLESVPAIDLNSDLGESFGNWTLGDDESMLDLVSSANIACGFHAGDPTTLRRVCQAAADRNVTIGAHVAYPDLVGFGRRFIDMEPAELRDAILYQLGALDGFAQVAGTGVGYVKPHGGLYHACITHPEQAEAVVQAAHEYDPSMAVLGAPGSPLLAVADAMGMEPVAEVFADRGYLADGRLVPRGAEGAVLTDPAAVAERAVRVAVHRRIVANDGTEIEVQARSICIHGDSPGAVEMARAVRAGLEMASVGIHSFVI